VAARGEFLGGIKGGDMFTLKVNKVVNFIGKGSMVVRPAAMGDTLRCLNFIAKVDEVLQAISDSRNRSRRDDRRERRGVIVGRTPARGHDEW